MQCRSYVAIEEHAHNGQGHQRREGNRRRRRRGSKIRPPSYRPPRIDRVRLHLHLSGTLLTPREGTRNLRDDQDRATPAMGVPEQISFSFCATQHCETRRDHPNLASTTVPVSRGREDATARWRDRTSLFPRQRLFLATSHRRAAVSYHLDFPKRV